MFSFERRTSESNKQPKIDKGVLISLINKLLTELHLPGYQYCSPGTKLHKRLEEARGDPGINKLDIACKQHDIAYDKSTNDLATRHKADYQLEQAAWNRVKSRDASIGGKASAWLITTIMIGRHRLGMGCKATVVRERKNILKKMRDVRKNNVKRTVFGTGIVRKVREYLKKAGDNRLVVKDTVLPLGGKRNIRTARVIPKAGGNRFVVKDLVLPLDGKWNIRTPRVIPVPKVGGILPLIHIITGLSALGSIIGTTTSIVKAVNDIKATREQKN